MGKAEITTKEWLDLKGKVKTQGETISNHGKRLDRHGKTIREIQTSDIRLPQEIGNAISQALEPVLNKVMNHDEKFHSLELQKEREDRERVERLLNEEKERRKWFIRTLIGTFLSAIIGPILAILSFMLSNNSIP